MGSCLGTNAAPPPKAPNSTLINGGSKSPSPVYEETFKEVLSETPAIPKYRLLHIPRFHERDIMLHQNGVAAKKPSDYEVSLLLCEKFTSHKFYCLKNSRQPRTAESSSSSYSLQIL